MADGQTIVQYGTLTLFNCVTRRIEQRPVPDSAGVGLKCWKYVVAVTGYLNGLSCGESNSNPTGATLADAHRKVRWRLPPRQTFVLAFGCTSNSVASGVTILTANSMDSVAPPTANNPLPNGLSKYDVADGPRCQQFDVTQVSGNNICRVEALFEINIVECDDNGNATNNLNGILAHRWACSDSIDVNLRTTRTYHGVLELATSAWSPHHFRSLVIPPLQPGMRRDRMEFAATEDGKTLQYTVTDVDVAVAAPFPARTWSIEHTVTSLNGDPLKITEQISVTLTGDHNVSKAQLMTLGLYIVTAKVTGAPPQNVNAINPPGAVFWNDLTVTDSTGDVNAVRLNASCWRPARVIQLPANANGSQPVIALASRLDSIRLLTGADLPPFANGYDANRSLGGRVGDPLVYQGPISLAGIFRCYLQSPCDNIHSINNANSTNQIADNDSQPSNSPLAQVVAVISPSIDTTIPDYYSLSHQASMYTYYEMESKYVTKPMRVACPIALAPYLGSGVDTRDATATLQLAPPQARRIVKIAAERVGDWPEFPDPETMDGGIATTIGSATAIRQTCIKRKLLSKTVNRSISGDPLYSARFLAIFALNRAPAASDNLRIGVNKWETDGDTATTATLTNSAQENPSADSDVATPGGGSY